MLDPITLLIIKTIGSACIKLYLSSLLGVGQVTYDSDELGYRIPKWYMNPGHVKRTFYSYGTSVTGDEFESIEDAHRQAIDQMAQHIRLSNRAMVEEAIHYDTSSVKQKRLIELFVRGDGLEEFIRRNATVDKRQLVKVEIPADDLRAFVRLDMSAKTYVAYQTTTLNALKTRLMQQKTDDILNEMQAEINAWNQEEGTLSPESPAASPTAAIAPPIMPDLPKPATLPAPAPRPVPGSSGGPFGGMEDELDDSQ
ncbi:MAG: hypothetical protein HQ523_14285 [Lentisphaerae bacterium]|nr:hypothetical protein [Lentisphaerota bacterium]